MTDRWSPTIVVDADGTTAFAEMEMTSEGHYVRAEDYYPLMRKLAEAERDAARYRWLRDADPSLPEVDMELLPTKQGEDLDRSIDAALSKPD